MTRPCAARFGFGTVALVRGVTTLRLLGCSGTMVDGLADQIGSQALRIHRLPVKFGFSALDVQHL